MIHVVGRLTQTIHRNRDSDFLTLRDERQSPANCCLSPDTGMPPHDRFGS